MPGYKGHVLGGITTYALLQVTVQKHLSSSLPPLQTLLITLLACILGSLFPDIDTKSVGQKIFYTILAVPIIASIILKSWFILSLLSLLSLLPVLVRHRGIIHSVWFVSIPPFLAPLILHMMRSPFSKIAWNAYLYFVTGALSHLLLDTGLKKILRSARK